MNVGGCEKALLIGDEGDGRRRMMIWNKIITDIGCGMWMTFSKRKGLPFVHFLMPDCCSPTAYIHTHA